MSEVESYIGKLTPVDMGGKTLDEWIMNKLGTKELKGYYENWLEALDDEYWKEFHFDENSQVLYAVEKQELDPESMSNFYRNDDGTYGFVVSFYNGGTYFGEVIQKGLDRVKEQENKDNVNFHIIRYDGYIAGDFFLKGIYFDVIIKVEGLSLEIVSVVPSDDAYPDIEDIHWESFVETIHDDLQLCAEKLRNDWKDKNTTFEKEFEKYRKDNRISDGAQMLMEITY